MQQRTRLDWRMGAAGALVLGLALAGWLLTNDQPLPPASALEPELVDEPSASAPRLAPQLQEPTANAVAPDSSRRVDLAPASEDAEEVIEPPPPIDWVLGKNLVEGIMLNAETREPIASARIRMDGFPIRTTESAQDGTFRLEAPDFVGTLTVAASGYALQRHFPLRLGLLPRDERGYVIYMEPGGQFRGVALKDDSTPVTTGVVRAYKDEYLPVVHVVSRRGDGPPTLSGWIRQVRTAIAGHRLVDWTFTLAPSAPIDKDGRFHFDSLPTGTPMHLAIWSNEVLRELHEQAALAPNEVREIKLVSNRASALTGSIELPFGVIPETSELWFTQTQMDQLAPLNPYDQLVPIGPNGEFDSGPLPPGKQIWVQACFMIAPDSPERIILDWNLTLDRPTRKIRLRLNGIVEDLPSDH